MLSFEDDQNYCCKKELPQLSKLNEQQMRQVLSIVYFYLCDIHTGIEILSDKNSNRGDDELFTFMLLSSVSKQSLRQLDQLSKSMKEKESKKYQNAEYVV